MRKIIIVFALLLVCAYTSAEGLDTLIELGRSAANADKAAREETDHFENVRKAAANGSLEKGQSRDMIRKRYGAPVIDFPKDGTGKETWVYKPGSASFFDGPKIYLFFDDNGSLDGIKTVEKKEEKVILKEIEKTKDEMPVLWKPKRQRHRL